MADAACPLERIGEVREGVLVAVALEHEVGEIEEGVALELV